MMIAWRSYALTMEHPSLVGVGKILKRMIDIIFSILILALVSLPILFIIIGIKISSSGPLIFKQRRGGLHGNAIYVWKFRTMSVMEDNAIVQAKRKDSRITRFGAFLRKTSLDELPQFINVILGDMSITGPRPHAIAHDQEYRKLVPGYDFRFHVKPGITGLAQISGWRGETDILEKMQKRIDYDLKYVREWSILLDLKIIILTVFKGFINKNAY